MGFIDRAGRFHITVEYERSDDYFSEGLPAVIQGETRRAASI